MPDRTRPGPSLAALLKGVSRSFHLSIQLLPAELRAPVGIAYLLARASDTIADAPGAPASQRIAALDDFILMVNGDEAPRPLAIAGAATEDERRLLQALPRCIEVLRALDVADRADIATVLSHITKGQRLDVERFADATAAQPRALETDAQLDEYTYLVAGCVGEFWTRLGVRHVRKFATRPEAQMMELGRRYGMALQLVNVIRDAGEDAANGRLYVPGGLVEPWLARTREGLECGLQYSLALESARVRVASALPALIGARTLALLQAAGPSATQHRVKVPRAQVRMLLARLAGSFGSKSRIEGEFRRALRDNRAR